MNTNMFQTKMPMPRLEQNMSVKPNIHTSISPSNRTDEARRLQIQVARPHGTEQ